MVRKVSIEHPNPEENLPVLSKAQKGDILFFRDGNKIVFHVVKRFTRIYIITESQKMIRISDGIPAGHQSPYPSAQILTRKTLKRFRKSKKLVFVNSDCLTRIRLAPSF